MNKMVSASSSKLPLESQEPVSAEKHVETKHESMEDVMDLREASGSTPTSTLVAAGMTISIQGGAKLLYCSSGGGPTVCDSDHRAKWETFFVVDAGSGYVGLRAGVASTTREHEAAQNGRVLPARKVSGQPNFTN